MRSILKGIEKVGYEAKTWGHWWVGPLPYCAPRSGQGWRQWSACRPLPTLSRSRAAGCRRGTFRIGHWAGPSTAMWSHVIGHRFNDIALWPRSRALFALSCWSTACKTMWCPRTGANNWCKASCARAGAAAGRSGTHDRFDDEAAPLKEVAGAARDTPQLPGTPTATATTGQ